MDTPAARFARRCLPLMVANTAGWELLNPSGFTAVWDGGDELAAVKIWPQCGVELPWVTSHFGCGILTWNVPYLFRSPRGYNLLVRGPANTPKDGIGALEGIVETDWTTATFTMNWKFTRPGYPVKFDTDEPFAMIAPMRRGELERFHPVLRDGASEPSLLADVQRFAASRREFLQALKTPGSAAERSGWQRHYMLGRNVDGTVAPDHQTKLGLAPFQIDPQNAEHGPSSRRPQMDFQATQNDLKPVAAMNKPYLKGSFLDEDECAALIGLIQRYANRESNLEAYVRRDALKWRQDFFIVTALEVR